MRKYKIVFIDDEKEIIGQTIKGIETLINVKDGLRLEYEILSDKQSIGKMNDIAADIVLFDCALYATDLDYGNSHESSFGLELMRKFREKNRRTRIIFYSSGFSLWITVL